MEVEEHSKRAEMQLFKKNAV